ncbi:hypothetical protein D3C87_1689550 [compost metagenome]
MAATSSSSVSRMGRIVGSRGSSGKRLVNMATRSGKPPAAASALSRWASWGSMLRVTREKPRSLAQAATPSTKATIASPGSRSGERKWSARARKRPAV